MSNLLSGLRVVDRRHGAYALRFLTRAQVRAQEMPGQAWNIGEAHFVRLCATAFKSLRNMGVARGREVAERALELLLGNAGAPGEPQVEWRDISAATLATTPDERLIASSLIPLLVDNLEGLPVIFASSFPPSKLGLYLTASPRHDCFKMQSGQLVFDEQFSFEFSLFPYAQPEAFLRLICYSLNSPVPEMKSPLYIENMGPLIESSFVSLLHLLGELPQAILLSEIKDQSFELVEIIYFWSTDPEAAEAINKICYEPGFPLPVRWLKNILSRPQDCLIIGSQP